MSASSAKKRVTFSVINCICLDQRVLKMAGTVSKLNCDITIIGRRTDDCCNSSSIPFRTRRFRMIFRRGFLLYKFFNIRLFFYLLFHRSDLLVANDLDTLLPNYLVSKLRGIPLVFDSHEYFTGLPEIRDRRFVRWLWTTIERSILPQLRNVLTVSNPIAAAYEKQYGIRSLVVRNCTKRADTIRGFPREELGIEKDHFLLILQGGGINMDKGGEELIEAIGRMEKVSLIIAGTGDLIPVLKKKVLDLNLSGRIRFYPAMEWEKLMQFTKSADAGMCLEKDTNLNYRFSLPNKLFEYISAGIPVITGSLPEIKKLVEEYDCGITMPEITPEEITTTVIKLKENSCLLNKLRQNSVIASTKLNWETESRSVEDFYKQVLKISN